MFLPSKLLFFLGFWTLVGHKSMASGNSRVTMAELGCEFQTEAPDQIAPRFSDWIFTRDSQKVGKLSPKVTVFENQWMRFGLKSGSLIPTGMLSEIILPIDEGSLLEKLRTLHPKWRAKATPEAEQILSQMGRTADHILELALLLKELTNSAENYFLFFSPLKFRWHGQSYSFSIKTRMGKSFYVEEELFTDRFFVIRNISTGDEFHFSGVLPDVLADEIRVHNRDLDQDRGLVTVSLERLLNFFGFSF